MIGMYFVNKDLSIYATRGDAVVLAVGANNNGVPYVFQPGEVVRFRVFEKKGCHCTVLQKDFIITDAVESVEIVLTKNETEIGEIISKPKDYWYEIELNPNYNPQTIVGYDDDGPKVFRLFPEGADVAGGEGEAPDEYVPAIGGYLPYVTEEDNGKTVRVVDGEWALAEGGGGGITVDDELSLTSTNPVQNCVVTREISAVTSTANTAQEAANSAGQLASTTNQLVNSEVIPRLTALEQNGGGGGGGTTEYNRVSVRDYGAVGDGVTNDQPAIWAAWLAAKALIVQDIPCELYFPAGTYGILEGGLGFGLPQGKGGLRITGAGREVTTIQYLEDWQPNSKYGGAAWYALDVHPDGSAEFWNYDTYIHDVAITGITIRDDYPDKHSTHTAKGTATTVTGGEENHGINIGYCIRAAVTDCNLIQLGDEVIDIYSCEDTIVMNNHIEGCPAAGPGGGAITIADGSKGAVVSGNTIVRSGADYVLTADDFGGADGITLPAGVEMSGSVKLPDGTVIGRYTKLTADTFIPVGTTIIKSNYAVAVESLYIPVSDVVITGNTIRDMHGKAMNLGCPNEGSAIINVVISDNVMSGCDDGIRFSGTHPKRSVKIHNNIFADIAGGAIEANAIEDMTVCGNTFRSISGTYAVGANGYAGNSRQLYANNVFEDIKYSAIVTAGMVLIKDCLFNGVGTAPQPATVYPAITKQDGTMTVSGCVMKNVRISSTSGGGGGVKSGIQGANVVEHTDIELIAKNGVANAGGEALSMVGSVIGGKFGGRINVTKENAIVQGVTIVSSNIGAHAITVAANGVSVTGCNINVNAASGKGAIGENSGYNYNLFANNITNRPIYTVGANTVAVNNINTAATA